jgi:hypothetical protein
MLTLYKSSLRLMRCLPEDIIGCRFNLEYDESQNRSLSTKRSSVIWSVPFCRALTALFVHPMWNKTTAALAVAIQYTIIASNGDRGPWIMPGPGCDTFLARLLDRKRQQPDASVTELRRQLHDEISAPRIDGFGRVLGTDADSDWDLLFQAIEGLAKPAAEPAYRPPSDPFLVHREHLDLLEKALNSMRRMGVPKFMPLDLYNRLINGRRSARDYPQQEDLKALRDYDILCELERLAFRAKQTPLDATEVPNTQPDVVIPETQQEPRGRNRPQSEPRRFSQQPTDVPSTVQPRKRARLEVLSTSQLEPSTVRPRKHARLGVPSASQLEPKPSDVAPARSTPGDLGKLSLQSQPEHRSDTSRVSDLFEPHKLSPPLDSVGDGDVGDGIDCGDDTDDGSGAWADSEASLTVVGPRNRHSMDDRDPIWDDWLPRGLPARYAKDAVSTHDDEPSGPSAEGAVSTNDHGHSGPSVKDAAAPVEVFEIPGGTSLLPFVALEKQMAVAATFE